MKRVLLLSLLLTAGAALAATSIQLTTQQEDVVCASRGGCGAAPPPTPIVCTPPKVINSAGTGCVDPPPPPANACAGFANTRIIDIAWAESARVFTKDAGGFGPNDIVVLRFKTGAGPSNASNLPRVTGAEWIDPLYKRNAVLSPQMCDFGPQPYPLAATNGTSIQVPFTVDSNANWGYYPILTHDTTYYLNVKLAPDAGCVAQSCNMFFDLYKAGTP